MIRLKFKELMSGSLENLDGLYRIYLCLNQIDINENDKILEIGCGAGLMSYLLSGRCAQVIATDVSKPMIDLLSQRPHSENIKFQVIDAIQEPPEDYIEAFDKVFCIDVIEHVDNPVFLLEFIAQVLKKNGAGVITFPINNIGHGKNYFTRESVLDFKRRSSLFFDIRFFNLDLIGRFLETCQSKIQNIMKNPTIEADLFEDYTCFKMLKNPRKIHNIYKLVINTFFYFHQNAYYPSDSGNRVLMIVRKDRI